MGGVRISTLNMTERRDRLAYVDGLFAHMTMLAKLVDQGSLPREDVERFHDQAFLARLFVVIDWDAPGGAAVTLWEYAHDWVSFEPTRLGILMSDGRLRHESEMLFIPTGEATAALAPLISELVRGTTRADLLDLAASTGVDLDDDFISVMLERGVVDDLARPCSAAPRFLATEHDRITWLGENGIVMQSGATTIWCDPLVLPRLRYQADELATAFAAQDAMFIPPPYGPDCEQLTVMDLPVPDAIVLSHEDVDVCDLALLMCVPESTPIVIPHARDKPWQVDLYETIRSVLGDRPIVRLAHGESHRIGDIELKALSWVGEWPTELPLDWNNYVVHGRTGTVVLGHTSALLAAQVDEIATAVGDRGPSALILAYQLYEGSVRYMHGFRESPAHLMHSTRPWPWFLPLEHSFDLNPEWGVGTETLRALRDRCGIKRYHPYGFAGPPWLRFQMPHVHRTNAARRRQTVFDRERELARACGYDVPPLQVGVPFNLG